MAKQKKTERERSRPLTVEALKALGVLDDLAPPKEPFDPAAAWTHTYRLWLVQKYRSGGMLVLKRKPAGTDGIHLKAALTIAEYGGYLRRVETDLDCAADALCSPRAWKLRATYENAQGKPTAGSGLVETGTIADGTWQVHFDGRSRQRRVPSPITCNWSLFEAVQRLPGKDTRTMRFAMLDEMDLLKPDQRLSFLGTKKVTLDGRTISLVGYGQIGRGVLPWQYWVDENGRLLLAISGVRAYVWDPKADPWVQRQRKSAQARVSGRR